MKPSSPPTTDAFGHESVSPDQPAVGWFGRLMERSFGYPRDGAVPAALSDQITVLGIPNARFWVDTQAAAIAQEAYAALEREKAAAGKTGACGPDLPPSQLLAVSGGSDDGSFGAGLLCGWADAGTMPAFKLVSGISTGSMIAPFAFLGGRYMAGLREVYTTIGPENVLKRRPIFSAIFGEALADTSPLYGLITHYIDERTLADLASAYNEGRLLLIGTVSLDAQRPIIWNIGAIAASGRPDALELIRKVILASASIPGAFPPVMIDVEAGGHRYQEMNVDGGVVAQTFLYPHSIGLRVNFQSEELARERHAYVIRNSRLDPDWASVNRRLLTISGRTIATMIHFIGYSDIVRIHAMTQRDGVDYNLAYIETDFPNVKHQKFDPAYMNALFDYGYAKGREGYRWHKQPPLLDSGDRG